MRTIDEIAEALGIMAMAIRTPCDCPAHGHTVDCLTTQAGIAAAISVLMWAAGADEEFAAMITDMRDLTKVEG